MLSNCDINDDNILFTTKLLPPISLAFGSLYTIEESSIVAHRYIFIYELSTWSFDNAIIFIVQFLSPCNSQNSLANSIDTTSQVDHLQTWIQMNSRWEPNKCALWSSWDRASSFLFRWTTRWWYGWFIAMLEQLEAWQCMHWWHKRRDFSWG